VISRPDQEDVEKNVIVDLGKRDTPSMEANVKADGSLPRNGDTHGTPTLIIVE